MWRASAIALREHWDGEGMVIRLSRLVPKQGPGQPTSRPSVMSLRERPLGPAGFAETFPSVALISSANPIIDVLLASSYSQGNSYVHNNFAGSRVSLARCHRWHSRWTWAAKARSLRDGRQRREENIIKRGGISSRSEKHSP